MDKVMADLNDSMAHLTGVRLFMQAVQDVTIGGRLTAAQYQYTLTDVDLAEVNAWSPKVQQALAKLPQLTDVASESVTNNILSRQTGFGVMTPATACWS